MNIDNQLLLGIVFITAGVAMGLLAYAAFLNRQDSAEDEGVDAETQLEATDEAGQEPAGEEPLEAEVGSPPEAEPDQEPPEPTVKAPDPIAEPDAIAGSEAETVVAPSSSPSEEFGPAETVISSPTTPDTPPDRPTVMVDRDPASDRLMVRIDDKTYRSIEALRQSDDWDRVTDLFSDLLAWMIRAEDKSKAEEEEESEESAHRPVSMIQEINAILGEKLAEMDSGPQAVRLMEGVGGSIRVYIGVESFSIDEVPDPQVKALIRQAVAEWEAR